LISLIWKVHSKVWGLNTMKRLLCSVCFSAVATTAFAADPFTPTYEEVATRQISGYGEVYVGNVSIDFLGESEDLWAAGGAARVNVPFADSWNAQGDLTFDAIGADGDSVHGVGGAVHLYWRDPASYAFGAFGEIKGYGFSEGGPDDDISDWKIGPEAQVYFGNATLYGQAYYGQLEVDAPFDIDLWGVRGVLRYFMQENLRFDAELGFHNLSADVVDMDTVSASVQAMYRFDNTPLSVFARYQFDRTSITEAPDDFDSHKIIVGLRASFGTGTLRDEDRNGATMDVWRPNFVLPTLF
jgi:hypothetical protein